MWWTVAGEVREALAAQTGVASEEQKLIGKHLPPHSDDGVRLRDLGWGVAPRRRVKLLLVGTPAEQLQGFRSTEARELRRQQNRAKTAVVMAHSASLDTARSTETEYCFHR